MKRYSFILFFLLTICYSNSQSLDSLIHVSKSQKGTALVKTLNEISWEYKNSNADSALYYGKKSLKIALEINSQKAVASSFNSIASSFEFKGNLDSAEIYHQKSLKIKQIINDTIGIADSYNNLGIVHDTKANYSDALEHYFKALEIYEKYSNEFDKVPMVLVNIGIVYKKQKEYDKVLEYYLKALKIYEKNEYEIGKVITMGNIGSVLLNLENYENSIKYSEAAKEKYSKLGYSRYMPYMQVNMAIAKDSLRRYKEARQDYITSIKAFEKDQNLYELTNAKIALAKNYSRDKKYSKALKQLDEALVIIKDKGFKENEVKAYKQLASINASLGLYKKAYTNFNNYAIGKDSLFEESKTKTIFELDTKYQTEKKEKEILIQRAELAEQDLTIQRQNFQVYGLIGLALLLGVLGYLFYNQQKLKNNQLKKENELKIALSKIETQNRLQEQRLRISRDLHDNIGAQLTFIISSLDNLKYGFDLPKKLSHKLDDIGEFTSSTIFELRDTIWAMNKNSISFEDLQSRISNFIEKADVSSKDMRFSYNVDNNQLTDVSFTSIQGINIYRIIQEAVNNSIKYSKASKIDVHIKTRAKNILISIIDNGIGFNKNEIEFGNGLNNIEKRALELNASASINSEKDKGTQIVLNLPIET